MPVAEFHAVGLAAAARLAVAVVRSPENSRRYGRLGDLVLHFIVVDEGNDIGDFVSGEQTLSTVPLFLDIDDGRCQ